MTALFSPPKAPPIVQPVDPADTANRLANQRLNAFAAGGSNVTTLSQAMGAASPQLGGPRATLTGAG